MAENYDVIFIGGGPAGYVGAIKAAQGGLKVACIEKGSSLGGTCLHIGCIPSKALLHATELFYNIKHESTDLGISMKDLSVDLAKMMDHKEKILEGLKKGIAYLFRKHKIEHIQGSASLRDPHTVATENGTYTAKYIVLATGSEPIALPFLPFDEERVLSSTGALSLTEVPKKLLIIGAGVIGLELGSCYKRLGAEVEVIELLDRIIPEFDHDLSKQFQKSLEAQGFKFHLSSKVTAAEKKDKEITLQVTNKEGKSEAFKGDYVLISIGRKPFTHSLGLEALGIEKDPRGFIKTNTQFQTNIPHIYAVGDVSGPPMLAHKASEEAVIVASHISGKAHEPLDFASIPNVIYTYPEVASVGFSEQELKEKKIPYVSSNFPFLANSRFAALASKEPAFIKALAHKETKHLLGVHIFSPNASELIAEPALALSQRLKVPALTAHSFAHPTLAEALHEAYLGLFDKPLHN